MTFTPGMPIRAVARASVRWVDCVRPEIAPDREQVPAACPICGGEIVVQLNTRAEHAAPPPVRGMQVVCVIWRNEARRTDAPSRTHVWFGECWRPPIQALIRLALEGVDDAGDGARVACDLLEELRPPLTFPRFTPAALAVHPGAADYRAPRHKWLNQPLDDAAPSTNPTT